MHCAFIASVYRLRIVAGSGRDMARADEAIGWRRMTQAPGEYIGWGGIEQAQVSMSAGPGRRCHPRRG